MFDSKKIISNKNKEFFINKFIWSSGFSKHCLFEIFSLAMSFCVFGAEVLGRKSLEVEFQIISISVELKALLVGRRLNGLIVWNVVAKVLLDDVVSELVDFDVLVILQVFDFRQAIAFLNQIGDLFSMGSSHFKHVVNSIQDYLKMLINLVKFDPSAEILSTYVNNLRVMATQQLAEGWNGSSLDQVRYLLLIAANRQVADGPCSLFLCLELSLGQVLDNLRQKSGVDDGLNL